ncbi:TetR/AcrR family transcriptional regulator [Streptomyces aurantiacus]|uniref:TetR family transcriptional regulator n=1 Tax=Streptomyces aurantiacus TaxID=47760 RepID=A0A7G1NPT8_9ACTN|nr:TetR/AcrR family transcriptional regulator [Streptomyces aurantiacus]BCL25228.1 TetR family transcriptional regulator [Streptomyces aurantiacus]
MNAFPARRVSGGPVLQDDVTDALTAAFFDELAAVGYGRLSIEAVAKRAGTGKAAVYRRWPSKQAMTVALVSRFAVAATGAPGTGSLRGDVTQYLREVMAALRHPLVSRIAPDLVAEAARNEELSQALLTAVRDPRRENAELVIRRAIERGELPADTDVELGLDFLVGPVYWRLVMTRAATEEDYLERLVTKIVSALGA